MLEPYRVLDLTNEHGILCGQILADLGADVIAIEPPGGSSARRIGPFAGDKQDLNSSLFWWAYARNKRGVTILLVEQNVHHALAIANRAYVLETGRVIKSGKSDELLNDPQVKNAYLGL